MIVVTGGFGFIGMNLVAALNARGAVDILIVDRAAARARDLSGLRFADSIAPEDFLAAIERGAPPGKIEAIYHQGACADTACADERCMAFNNVEFPDALLNYAIARKVPFVYASSAAVYGGAREFTAAPENERPLNLYGRSKLEFDNRVRSIIPNATSTIAGLRYFNVYGPREAHKGRMASMVYQLYRQLKETGRARLFAGSGGYADGEQRRDFVFVDDVVRVNLEFGGGPARTGIFNVGAGEARTFNEAARALIARLGAGAIEYVPFPESLAGRYQNFTRADLPPLRAAGIDLRFASLEEGIARAAAGWERESPATPP
ncbi:MAG: ADP-glyceromanno-heptose 6-epimerase [Candidatus Binataceae bacterium]